MEKIYQYILENVSQIKELLKPSSYRREYSTKEIRTGRSNCITNEVAIVGC